MHLNSWNGRQDEVLCPRPSSRATPTALHLRSFCSSLASIRMIWRACENTLQAPTLNPSHLPTYWIWVGAQEFVALTSSQVIWDLLAKDKQWEHNCHSYNSYLSVRLFTGRGIESRIFDLWLSHKCLYSMKRKKKLRFKQVLEWTSCRQPEHLTKASVFSGPLNGGGTWVFMKDYRLGFLF